MLPIGIRKSTTICLGKWADVCGNYGQVEVLSWLADARLALVCIACWLVVGGTCTIGAFDERRAAGMTLVVELEGAADSTGGAGGAVGAGGAAGIAAGAGGAAPGCCRRV